MYLTTSLHIYFYILELKVECDLPLHQPMVDLTVLELVFKIFLEKRALI